MSPVKDISGQRFDRLYVEPGSIHRRNGSSYWWCVCDCGNRKSIRGAHIRGGRSKSCGCLTADASKERHATARCGITCHPLRPAHRAMVARCHNPNADAYRNYGARGIRVCDQWRGPDGFRQFLADMGERPFAGASLERIDNAGDYEPGNVRWASSKEQGVNKRTNRMVEFRGQMLPLVEVARLAGVPYKVLHKRIDQFGWPLEKAVTEPIVSDAVGESASGARLTEDNVREILRMRAARAPYDGIAEFFGVSRTAVQDICNGRTWTHITLERQRQRGPTPSRLGDGA